MGFFFRSNGDGFEARLVVRWALLVATLKGLLPVIKALIIVIVAVLVLINSSGMLAQLKLLIDTITRLPA